MNSRIALSAVALLLALCGCGQQDEGRVANAAGTYSFCCVTSKDGLLEVKVADGKGANEWSIDTRASCYQKYGVTWIDDATILVASSDIGFLVVDATNRCMTGKVDVKRRAGEYLVRVLNDQGESVRSIAVAEDAMPKTTLLKYVEQDVE